MSEKPSNVIRLKQNRPKDWSFSMDFFLENGEWAADISGFNDDPKMEVDERMRMMADCLDAISFMTRQQAEKFASSKQGAAVATAIVFADGSVRTRLNDDKFRTEESQEWLMEHVDYIRQSFDNTLKETEE